LISQALFCLTYAWLSWRVNWVGSWLVGWGMFGVSTVALEQVALPLPFVFLSTISSLGLVQCLWPRSRGQEGLSPAPAWAILGRMGVATGLVLALTSAAPLLGPHLSGLLAPLPVFATVFAVFAHHLQGEQPARQILHGVVLSSFACAVFFLIVAEVINQWSLVVTFSVATMGALLTQGGILWLAGRHPSQSTSKPSSAIATGYANEWKGE
jgi:hypothetical protein